MNINFKRILSSTLAVLAIGGGIAYSGAEGMSDIFDTETISAYAAETKNYNGLEYVEYALDTELQARIVGYTGTEAVLEIPAIIDGRQVIIDSNAFNGNTIIKKVTVSEGITHILSGAFANCPNLEEINVPASLEIIMLNSFTGSDKLKFTGDGVPTIVSTMATSWCLDNNIYSITSSDTNLKYYQRAVKIASELKKDLTYDSSAPNQGDAASVLNTLKATCGGYSRVFYHICLAAGIPEDCIKVVGDCHCHAWNYINISGDWYNVDVTNSIYFATDANYAKTMFNNTNTSHAYH
ncbi:MAG: leucine-rich repeat protein, partial [Ruminococcus sp.]|nr:leucine-rich repeat protein [Ruminococcus sp.]